MKEFQALLKKNDLDVKNKKIIVNNVFAQEENNLVDNIKKIKGSDHKTICIDKEMNELREQPILIKTRKEIYDEIWEISIAGLAKKYDIPYGHMIRQIKIAGIPVPPSGYWMKLSSGKKVSVFELTGDPEEIISIYKITPGVRSKKNATSKLTTDEVRPDISKSSEIKISKSEANIISQNESKALNFLDNETRSRVLAVAEQINLPYEGSRMHSKIIAHRKKVSKWQRELKKNKTKGWGRSNLLDPPFLADTISEESLPRVCRILDALVKSLEPLGCMLTDDLKIKIKGNIIYISITEAKSKTPHVLTKKENLKLLEYEERRKKYSYITKPKFSKYDYFFNGRISLKIHGKKTYKDCKTHTVEEKLGNIVVTLYEVSDMIRQEREEREEEERQKEIERKKEVAKRERYNLEVKNTEELLNKADDYEVACKIRAYVSELEKSNELDDKAKKWNQWAKKKADWYDPTVALDDKYFGIRKHNENSESKKLKELGYFLW